MAGNLIFMAVHALAMMRARLRLHACLSHCISSE